MPPEARGEVAGLGRLAGRRILVVGAGTRAWDEPNPPVGNGRAIAVLAAREGAAVACADQNESAALETAQIIEKEGGRAAVVVADVTEEAACERVVVESQQALQGLDGIVLNVGIAEGRGLEGTTPENWDRTFAVNLRAHFLVARAALPHLGEGASIVFISSVAGRRAGSRLPAYDASKAGLEGLCRHVAFEGARRGVRANLVVPGLIDTPLGRLATRGRPGRGRTPVPLGRQGTGWEVGYATLFLLSNESSYVTGQSLIVDGGLSELR
jgi:NAD(P)-dependent dehydrogenase (short-subunit alcohol dehydrogenase family)